MEIVEDNIINNLDTNINQTDEKHMRFELLQDMFKNKKMSSEIDLNRKKYSIEYVNDCPNINYDFMNSDGETEIPNSDKYDNKNHDKNYSFDSESNCSNSKGNN